MTIGPAVLSILPGTTPDQPRYTLSIRYQGHDYRTPVPSGDMRDALALLQEAGEAFADRMFRRMHPVPGPVEAMFPPPIPQFAYVEGEKIREMLEKLAGRS